ncbi:VOC family protein [Tsuneonella mangrovi]|uniref:VOC family protein n=1 Tax=Tsuneonella mangrovi TaxID=1982042 RepID=UPI000BA21A9A|nr:VOC family protein [Tsuneonella mangrovi]
MTQPIGGITRLGPVMQLAFVPSDFDAAIDHWTKAMGVGPFFMMENIALEDMRYRGEPTDAVFSLALAYWGDVQIELIRPENDAPSIYSGEYGVRDRLHHTCLLLDDIADAYAACKEYGAEVLVEAKVGDSGAVIYADPGGGPGHLVEMLQTQPGTHELFAMIKQAGIGWDGSDPVRKLG